MYGCRVGVGVEGVLCCEIEGGKREFANKYVVEIGVGKKI